MQFFKDWSLSAFVAGFVAVLVGLTSSVAIVFQAAQAFQATPAQTTSWIWALGWGMGLCTLVPSLWLRKPVMVAWSTPGAAVLATAGLAGGFTMGEAVGTFMACAALITVVGITGWFERAMNRLPMEIAAALLAGVLARFGLQAFAAAQTALPLVLWMLLAYLLAYLLARRWAARYAVVWTLAVGVACAALGGQMAWSAVSLELAVPQFTAAICMGPEAHDNPSRRYTAAVSCGALYILVGTFGAVIVGLLSAFPPPELVVAITGLVLLSTIGNGLAAALHNESHREAALITFLVTLSGVTLAGVGSAFWGVVAGSVALFVQQYAQRRHPRRP